MKDFVDFIHCSVPSSWHILEILWILKWWISVVKCYQFHFQNSHLLSSAHLPLLLSSRPYHFFLGLLFNFPTKLYTPGIIAFIVFPAILSKIWNLISTQRNIQKKRGSQEPSANLVSCFLLLFSHWVVSDSLPPHGLHFARLPCPSPSSAICSNSCPFSRWCHPTISFSVIPFSSCLNLSWHQVFSNESVLPIRWPKYWSFGFSISPSNEYSGLISFRINWLDLLAVQGTLKSLLQHHSINKNIKSSALSLLYCPPLTSIHNHWKNHSFDYMDHCWQSNVSVF